MMLTKEAASKSVAETTREAVLFQSEKILSVLSKRHIENMLKEHFPVEYEKVLEAHRQTLIKEFGVAIAASMSAGKSSLTNAFFLGYPLLPFCVQTTTCVPTVIKYGKTPKIEVAIWDVGKSGKNSLDETKINKIKIKRKFDIPCSPEYIKKDTFHKLLNYYADCYYAMGLENPLYFVKDREKITDGHISADNLMLSYSDPKHITMVYLGVMCAYMAQNERDEYIDPYKIDARNRQKELLQLLGFKQGEENYTVTVYWDAPVLKKGIVLYDLPGLNADNEASDTHLSHDKITKLVLNSEDIKSVLYLFKPGIDKSGIDAITAALQNESIKQLQSKTDRVITCVNKVDLLGDEHQIKIAMDSARTSMLHMHIDCPIHSVAAQLYGDYTYVKNGIINVKNVMSNNVNKSMDPSLMGEYAQKYKVDPFLLFDKNSSEYSGLLTYALDKECHRYEPEKFIAALEELVDRAYCINTLDLYREVCKLIKNAKNKISTDLSIYQQVCNAIDFRTREIIMSANRIAMDDSDSLLRQLENDIPSELDKVKTMCEDGYIEGFFTKIDGEFRQLRKKLCQKKDSMQSNIFGDIVIARNNGRQANEPNFTLWSDFKKAVATEKFADANLYISEEFLKMIAKIQDSCINIDKMALCTYSEILNGTKEAIIEKINDEISELKTEAENISKTSHLTIDVEKTGQQIKAAFDIIVKCIDECLDQIETDLEQSSNISELREDLAQSALNVKHIIENAVVDEIKKKLYKLLEKGMVVTSTDLVRESYLTEFIDKELSFSSDFKNDIRQVLSLDSLINEFLRKAEALKKRSVNRPASILSHALKLFAKTLEGNGSIDEYKEKMQEELCMLGELLHICNGKEMDAAVDAIRRDEKYQNELLNIDNLSFDALLAEIQQLYSDWKTKMEG